MPRTIKRKADYFVYMVECNNGTYYTGYTGNLEGRIKRHNSGNGSKYLRGKLPVRLVYAKGYRYYKSVLHAERDIKGMTRKQKEALVRSYEKKNARVLTPVF